MQIYDEKQPEKWYFCPFFSKFVRFNLVWG